MAICNPTDELAIESSTKLDFIFEPHMVTLNGYSPWDHLQTLIQILIFLLAMIIVSTALML